jgi:hypothetical protein
MSGKGEVEQLSGVQFLHWKIYGAKFPWEFALHSFYTLSLSFLSELKDLLFRLLLFAYSVPNFLFFPLLSFLLFLLMSYLFASVLFLSFLYYFLLFMQILFFFCPSFIISCYLCIFSFSFCPSFIISWCLWVFSFSFWALQDVSELVYLQYFLTSPVCI